MLRIPLKSQKRNSSDNLIAKRGESPVETHFYRIKSLKTEGKVEFQIAEFDEPKIPKGKIPDASTERLVDICELSCSKEVDLIWLLEFTTGKKIGLPEPVSETPLPNQSVPPGSLL